MAGEALVYARSRRTTHDKAVAQVELVRAHLDLGRDSEALRVAEEIPNAYRKAMALTEVAVFLAGAGHPQEARDLLARALPEAGQSIELKFRTERRTAIAVAYAGSRIAGAGGGSGGRRSRKRAARPRRLRRRPGHSCGRAGTIRPWN